MAGGERLNPQQNQPDNQQPAGRPDASPLPTNDPDYQATLRSIDRTRSIIDRTSYGLKVHEWSPEDVARGAEPFRLQLSALEQQRQRYEGGVGVESSPATAMYEPQADVDGIRQKLQAAIAKPQGQLTNQDFFEVLADIATAFEEEETVSWQEEPLRRAILGDGERGGYHLYFSQPTPEKPLQEASLAWDHPYFDYDFPDVPPFPGTTHVLTFTRAENGSIGANHYTSETELHYPLNPEHERYHLKILLKRLPAETPPPAGEPQ